MAISMLVRAAVPKHFNHSQERGNNMTFKDTFGVEYSEDRLTLLKCPTSLEGSYTVSPMANTIAPKSIDGCTNLTSIVLPTSLISIEANAFDNCNELKEIH